MDSGVSITKWICSRCGSRWASDKNCPICMAPVRLISSSEVGDDPMVGKKIGNRYQVMARIGKGSVGNIFRTFDTVTERQVALKLLRKHFIRDDELRRRFEQEAIALKRLQHKNLISVREFCLDTLEPYFIMEYIDGMTLATLIGELTYIPPQRFIRIFSQVIDALAYAHDQGIFHRDIKPENILLIDLPREKDVVKLVDFGLAKIADEASRGRMMETTGRQILGTPLYMSPEQARGLPIDARSDIYALGCVMYEALCGVPPVKGTGVMEILRNQIEIEPPPMSEMRPLAQVPARLDQMVMKSLSKKPEERHQNMRELQDELLAIKADMQKEQEAAAAAAGTQSSPTPLSNQVAPPPETIWSKLSELFRRQKKEN